jgi:hypothetical protein
MSAAEKQMIGIRWRNSSIHSRHPTVERSRKTSWNMSAGKRIPDRMEWSFVPQKEQGMPDDWNTCSISLESVITQISDIALF